jgi:hypothetical protein
LCCLGVAWCCWLSELCRLWDMLDGRVKQEWRLFGWCKTSCAMFVSGLTRFMVSVSWSEVGFVNGFRELVRAIGIWIRLIAGAVPISTCPHLLVLLFVVVFCCCS